MRQPSGTFFSLSTRLPVDKGEWQTSNARSTDSEVCWTLQRDRHNRTVPPHLLFDHIECQRNCNQHKENRIKLNTKVRKMSPVRDTGYLAGVLLSTAESNWRLSVSPPGPLPSLCLSLLLHLNSSYPVSFLLPFVIFLTPFPSPLLPPSALLSLIQLSSLPFQSACYFTPSFCENKEIGREARTIKHHSTFSPLSHFTYFFKIFLLVFLQRGIEG